MSSSRWWRVAVPLALMAAITVASSRPGHTLPSMSFQFSDKLVHAAAFAVLAVAWYWALGARRWTPVAAVVICALFGVADELHQSTVPGRFPDVFDAIADIVGAILGVALARAWLVRDSPRQASTQGRETHGDHSQLSRQDPEGR